MRRLLIAALALLALAAPAAAQFDGGPGSRPRTAPARQVRPLATRNPLTIVSRAADQTISNGSWTAVSWDTKVQDDVGAFSSASPTVLTVPDGYTRAKCVAYTVWNNNSTGQRFMRIDKAHAGSTATLKVLVLAAAFESGETIPTRWLSVAPGDTLSVLVIQSSGANLGLAGTGDGFAVPSDFQCEWAP